MNQKFKKILAGLLSTVVVLSTEAPVALSVAAAEPETPSAEEIQEVNEPSDETEYNDSGYIPIDEETYNQLPKVSSVSEYFKYLRESGVEDAPDENSAANFVSSLPAVADNSTNDNAQFLPEVDTQGSIGSCACWASVYYQLTYMTNKARGVKTTKQNTLSPNYIYNLINWGEDLGSNFYGAYDMVKVKGAATAADAPIKSSHVPASNYLNWYATGNVWENASANRLVSYAFLRNKDAYSTWVVKSGTPVTAPDSDALYVLKSALARGEILTFTASCGAMKTTKLKSTTQAGVDNSFVGQQAAYCWASTARTHAMTLVGYNDNIWIDVNSNNQVDAGEMGAFKILNSWGKGYGNGGYLWVAYDALNSVSSVSGAPTFDARSCVFASVGSITVSGKASDASGISLNYTLNSKNRQETPVVVKATNKSTNAVTSKNLTPYHHSSTLGAYSYNGTTTACDGVMSYDLNNVIPGITSDTLKNYTWTVELKDKTNDANTLLVKEVKIVDRNANKEYVASDAANITLNGTSKTVTVPVEGDDITKNEAVIYYKGYSNPYIHYQVAGGSWTPVPGVKMTATTEQSGYTHKYTIDLGTASYATVCFNDGNNSWDSNNGSNYKFNKGTYGYSSGKIVEISKPTPAELTAKASITGGNKVPTNQSFTIVGSATGGTAPYQYKYTYSDSSTETVIKDFSTLTSTSFKFTTPGTYTVKVTVKDSTGKTATATTSVSAYTIGALSIDSFTTTSPAQITYPARVYTTVSVSGGTEPYTYQFGYIQNGKTTYYNSQTYGRCEYFFTEVGTKFTPIVKVTDAKGDTAQKQLNEFTIVDGIKIESLTTTPASPIKVGTEITFNPVIKNAVSKYGRYSSALITINKDNTKVAEVDYNNGKKTWTPTEAGTYTATFDLSDFYGAKASKTITFTVQKDDPVTENEVTIYYKGYSSPYIHYQVDGGSWTNAPGYAMTATTEQSGYTHKYTIKLGQKTFATVCFNDGNNSWDSNNGSNYKFNKGTYGYSGGKIVEISKPTPAELTAKASITGGNNVPTNQNFTIVGSAAGGTAPYQYKYTYSLGSTETVIKDFSTLTSTSFKFTTPGTYTVKVTVKDSTGKTATATTSVSAAMIDITGIRSSKTTIKAGETVTFSVSNNNTAGIPVTYKYTVTGNGTTQTLSSTSASATWTPSKEGTYTLSVSMLYNGSAITTKTMSYTVEKADPVTENTVTIYYKGYSTPYIHYQVDGGSWTNAPGYAMTATSEVSGYTHKYTIKLGQKTFATVCFNNGGNSWDSNNGSNYKFNKGTYTFSNGTITPYNPVPQELSAKVDITGGSYVPANVSCTINATATGGTAPYQYQFTATVNGTEKTIKSYSTSSSVSYKPETGISSVKVTIKDSTGKTAQATTNLYIVNVGFGAFRASKDKAKTGENVTFTAMADNYRLSFTYKFTITGNGTTQTLNSTTGTATWIPSKEGTYTVKADILYYGSVAATKSMSYTVEKGDDVDLNQVVIYYKGYSTPYIHYQVGNGSWTNAPGYAMTATSEMSGYTHKYTIDLGTQSYANVCFNDGKGNWDSRNGANYRFTKGKYTFANGVISNVPNKAILVVNPLVTNPTLSAEKITLGDTITAKCDAEGGKGECKYAFYYKKASSSKWVTAQNFDTNNTVSIKPAVATEYEVCIKAKDNTGVVQKKYFTVKVQKPFENKSTLSATEIKLGETVTASAAATGGSEEYVYGVYYKKQKSDKWATAQKYGDNNVVTFKPAAATTYDVCVKVKDSDGNIAKQYFTVNVVK